MSYELLDTDPKFAFCENSLDVIENILKKYPNDHKQSAVLPLLEMGQRQNEGWISKSVIEEVASKLEMPFMRVYEVVTFYSMFNLKPVGKYLMQFCRTTPCWLRGAETVEHACKKYLGIDMNETTQDGMFTLKQVECLGACVNAPVVQINDDYHEDLDEKSIIALIDKLRGNHD